MRFWTATSVKYVKLRIPAPQSLLVVLPAVLAACAAVGPRESPRPARPEEQVISPAQVPPLGYCRILYTGLPPERQPAHMACGRAHAIAERHGGRVVKAISKRSFQDGRVLSMDYGPGRMPGSGSKQP
jgi:hypothetical protein